MDMQIRAISEKNNIKMSVVDITESLAEITVLQKTNPLASVALGRTLIANALVSLSVKDGDKVSTNINGMGLGGTIIAEFQNNTIRGYIEKPNFDIEKVQEGEGSALSQVIGTNGFLQVTRELNTKEPYTSRVELISSEINMDFMYYLQQSDQIKSLITTSVELNDDGTIKKACGIMLQLLPGYSDETIDYIEEKIGSLSHLINTLVASTNYEALLKDICDDSKVLDIAKLRFECTCNLSKVMESVKLLGVEELKKAYTEGEVIEVICDFCKKKYNVNPKELENLLV